MEFKDIQKTELVKIITLRITLKDYRFLKKNKLSASKIFRECIKNIKAEKEKEQ